MQLIGFADAEAREIIMYKRFRDTTERMMPVLFVGSLILLGMSAGQHDIKNMMLFGIAVIGTLPLFHKESWCPLLCPKAGGSR